MFAADKPEKGFTALFNGQDLTGWTKAKENEDAFQVKDGVIVANGKRSHLYFTGPFKGKAPNFKNFELKVDVMTKQTSNGGIYFHTAYQELSWPEKGFEVQVNNSHTDRIRGGSLYHVVDLSNIPAKDDEWYPMEINVQDMVITITVKGEQVVRWKQPADWTTNYDTASRKIAPGTFAFQAHDPNSVTAYANIRVKALK